MSLPGFVGCKKQLRSFATWNGALVRGEAQKRRKMASLIARLR
jgi:hypothetical protein